MSFGNIIGGMLQRGTSQNRLRTGIGGSGGAGQGSDIERMLGSFLGRQGGGRASLGAGGGAGGAGGFGDMARDFLGSKQAGGMSGAQIGGAGAALGAVFGGGLGGAAKGGAMALLGTMALKALRDHQAGGAGAATAVEPTDDEVAALTSPSSERLALRAMIGAAQVDGHVDEAEMSKILGQMNDGEVTEEERQAAREEANRPVDVEVLGREIDRPEVATEVYLAALLAVEVDTEAERDYFRRLASALRLEQGVVDRLHRMTGAPAV